MGDVVNLHQKRSRRADILQGRTLTDSNYRLALEIVDDSVEEYGGSDYTISVMALLLRDALFTIEELRKK